MSFVVTIQTSQPVPTVLSEAEIRSRVEALPNTGGFLGVKPGNPIATLWATEADANAYSTSVQADTLMAGILQVVEVTALDSTPFTTADFFDMQTTFPENPNA